MSQGKDDNSRGSPSRDEVQLLSKAEALLDRTLAYQAAQAVHELKATLGIDIAEINLAVSVIAQAPGAYRVSCTIVIAADTEPLKFELVVNPGKTPA